ncbi:hypothetical protein H5392_05345 [Tessaracoccus sp. MC1865]|uniref:hypothetical protein n=1 Tax=Tessaracoccus sp. MC1865 TaxID=2760310 RepID=UPI001604467B|nr:hypothetical protein [Tessaracoccus sp. MC1865]MBB1483289.1 hypothetical protein [Tessaracoccus sp. MC1865]QTO37299.1 hypothetical protein J7D54_12865 [Tessaracoccus sp. MC1865]
MTKFLGTSRYHSRSVQPDGTTTEYDITECDSAFSITATNDAGEPQTRDLGALSGGLVEALQYNPALLRVGAGFTDITTNGGVGLHELLGMLVVDEPGEPDPSSDDWLTPEGEPKVDLGIDIEDWGYDEEILSISPADGHDIVPRWIRINGERAFVLRGPAGFAAVGMLDNEYEWARPTLTQDLLSWRFYGESGGPCTWDGGAGLGWCGSRLWAFNRWGDVDPVSYVVPAPRPEGLARELAGWILSLDWELPYLLSAVGMPGLGEDERKDLWGAQDMEGQEASSHLGEELDREVVEILCDSYPQLKEATEGLCNPNSERGQLIYAWIRQIVHGSYQSGSWNQVHSAMVGGIEPPADDQRAPTMQERWEHSVKRATAIIESARVSD